MVVNVLFLAVTAILLAGLGRFAPPRAEPDVDPPFARAVARGLVAVWLAGGAHADRTGHHVGALSGRDSGRTHPASR